MKVLLSGNEAIARGAYEAGVTVATAYPGTPSTEILENIVTYKDIYAEWSPNEKVALEVGTGAAIAGRRVLVAMKHVGVNVAADALLTLTYTGVNAGLILMVSDDPGMHSSQNEQDSRNYAKFAKVPMLDPSDSQEAYEMVRAGFEISEQFDTPLMLRTTTRISHAKGVVVQQGKIAPQIGEWVKDVPKYVMLPNFGKLKHIEVEARLLKLQEFAETTPLNRIEMRDTEFGIITSGVSYQHVRESCPNASILKLGMVHPLPAQKILEFAKSVKHLVIVEEMDAIFEEQIRAMGINVKIGKNKLPLCGEINADLISAALGGAVTEATSPVAGLPQRPPVFCPSCAHRGLFTILSKLKVFVSGDIGCYTLGALPPMSAMHSVIDMGASISAAHGMAKVNAIAGRDDKPVAVIGDSTFFHSGMTGLMSMAYNGGNALVIIMDNRTTGMTGGQENPGTGETLQGIPARQVEMVPLVKALGIDNVVELNAYDLKETEAAIKKGLETPGPYVLIDKNPCILRYKIRKSAMNVDQDKCTGCRACLKVACMALGLTATGEKQKVRVDPNVCNGCGICKQTCKFDAMHTLEGENNANL